jgi:hypothetical protein
MNKFSWSAFVAAFAMALSSRSSLAMIACPEGVDCTAPVYHPLPSTGSGSTSGSASSSGGGSDIEYNSPGSNSGSVAPKAANQDGTMNLGTYNANLNSGDFQNQRGKNQNNREDAVQAAEWFMDCKSHWPMPGTCAHQLSNLKTAPRNGLAGELAEKACTPIASISNGQVGQNLVQVEQDAYLYLGCLANNQGASSSRQSSPQSALCSQSLAPLEHEVAVRHNYYNSCQASGSGNCQVQYNAWQTARQVCLPLATIQGDKRDIDLCNEVTCSDPSQNAKAYYNGKDIALNGVCNVTIEGLADATLIGQVQHFETSDPQKDCLDGESINYWTAPKEFPGVYVVHNGWMGPQCSYGTWTFPQKSQTGGACQSPNSASAVLNGRKLSLQLVTNVTIEGLPDATLVGQVQQFETCNPQKDCLNGESINYWTAPKEFPGVYVVHNGWMGSQCTYGTWTFQLKSQ